MKALLVFFVSAFAALSSKAQLDIKISNISASNSITCRNDTIKLVAWSTYSIPVTFSWTGPTNFSGPLVKITLPGNYTVTASADNLSVSQVTVIGSDFISPTSTISPLSQSISCSLNSVTTISASTSLSLNLTHSFMSPLGGTVISNSSASQYKPSAPGTYTHCVIDNLNGCSTCKTFTVSGGQGIPTGSLVSNQDFTIACSSKSVTTLSFTNFVTNPLAGGPISFTVIGPPTSSVFPTGPLSSNSSYSLNTPGTWTLIVRDNTTFCDLRLPFSIQTNYYFPNSVVVVPRQVLTCSTPTVRLLAYSSKFNTEFNWLAPGLFNINSHSITAFILPAFPSNTLISNYTLTLLNTSNLCINYTVVPVFQNIFKPQPLIGTGGMDPCTNGSVLLTNLSTSGIPANSIFTRTLAVNAIAWSRYGVLLQPTTPSASTYQTIQQGVYTMTVIDLNNGCMSSTNTNVSFCVGLEEKFSDENTIHIYPNPGEGLYYFISESMSEVGILEIYNSLGALIREQKMILNRTTIDIQNEAKGLYFFILKKDHQIVYTRKIIKQ